VAFVLNGGHRVVGIEKENCTVVHGKVKHQIPHQVLNTGHVCDDGDKGRASRMAHFLIPASLFSLMSLYFREDKRDETKTTVVCYRCFP